MKDLKVQNTNMYTSYFIDKKCGVKLCPKCVKQMRLFNFDANQKYISMQMTTCKFANHPNFFLPMGRQLVGNCTVCKHRKIIKIMCGMCE